MKLRAKNLSLIYGGLVIFKNLSLKLSEGEILAVQGDNGSGKTSLCHALSGTLSTKDDMVFGGEIFLGEKEINSLSIKEKCQSVGIVFQNPDNHIFSPLVIEELVFGLENLGLDREEMKIRLANVLKCCGIEHLKDAKTLLLSSGEKQLVSLASVLIMEPQLLILDEITSRMDSNYKEKIRNILVEYVKSGKSVILVSHTKADIAIADKLLIMEKGRDYSIEKKTKL